jgi:transposase
MRKNSLFFGNEDAGRRFMVLYSLLAMCERHDVNPEAYLSDVLLRIQDQPKDRLAELLPHRWKEARGSGFAVERVVTPDGAV